MKRQKSFEHDTATLYLVPTPIGNLQEMTPRALQILKEVDVIACEDTRNTRKLCSHFDISTRLVPHHNFNEEESARGLLKELAQGKNIAVVSDAGYPCISDPGYRVVQEAIDQGYHVVSLSGCNAMLNALVASGLPTQHFMFVGFLGSTKKEMEATLQKFQAVEATLIFYESPHRITKMLETTKAVLGNRKACLARELTKLHEELIRGTLDELIEVSRENLKGEMVVVVAGADERKPDVINLEEAKRQIQELVTQGCSASSAIKQIAKETGLNKNELYRQFHEEA